MASASLEIWVAKDIVVSRRHMSALSDSIKEVHLVDVVNGSGKYVQIIKGKGLEVIAMT